MVLIFCFRIKFKFLNVIDVKVRDERRRKEGVYGHIIMGRPVMGWSWCVVMAGYRGQVMLRVSSVVYGVRRVVRP